MSNNNINNQNNNNQPRPPASSANTFYNCNAASGSIRPARREFYNRQDMMIMNEIMRAANLFNPNNNDTTTNQQQQQHCQTGHSSASTSHQAAATVPPGFVPMVVRPQMLAAHSAMHGVNFGGAGDTAPLYSAEPPPGSMLLNNMLLVPVGQAAPMLENDLRRAQELYPPMNLNHEPQVHNITGALEAPPMNAWPHGRAPRQHEFFERSCNIIRSLQGSWSPVFGTYVNIPVNQISDNQVGATITNVVPTHGLQVPYIGSEGANNEPMADSMDPMCSHDSNVSGDEMGHFLEKKNLNNQFKDKNGPKPVEPPAFELKTVLTYSQVVRNLANNYPLSSTAPPKDQDPSDMSCEIAENPPDELSKIDASIEPTTGADSQNDELSPVEKSETLELEDVLVLDKGEAEQQHQVREQDQDQVDQQQEIEEEPLAEENEDEAEQPRVETEQQKKKRLLKEQKQKEQEEKERQQEEQVQKERHHIELLHKKLLYNQKNQQKKEERILKEQQRIDKLQKKLAFKAQRQKEILQKEEQQKEQKLKGKQQRQEAKRGQRKKEKQGKKGQAEAQTQKQQKLLQQQQQQQQQTAAQAKSQKLRCVQQNNRSNNATATVVSGKTTTKTLTNIGGVSSNPLPIILNSPVVMPTTKPSSAVTCMRVAPIVKPPSPVGEKQTNQDLDKNQSYAVLPAKNSISDTTTSPTEPLETQPNKAATIYEQQPIDNKNDNDFESLQVVEQSSSIPAVEQSSSILAVEQSSSVLAVEQSSSVPVVEQFSNNQVVEQLSSIETKKQSSSIEIIEQSSNTSSVEQPSNEIAINNPGNNTKRGKKRRCRRRRRQRKSNSNRQREKQTCADNNLERGSFMQTLWIVLKFGFQLVMALLIILYYTIRNYFK